jgi:hypothetical protein
LRFCSFIKGKLEKTVIFLAWGMYEKIFPHHSRAYLSKETEMM